MAKKTLTTDFNEVITLEVGDTFEGVYLDKRPVMVDGDERTMFTFRKGRAADAPEVDIWGSGQLKQYMAKIKPGTYVYITRIADTPSPSFKNTMMKTYTVEIDA